MNIYDLISRAQKLRQETKLDSVSPDRVGALCEDTLKYINEFQLLASSPSLHKIYASVSAMQADKSPKSDLTGKALKPGQLVVIVPANQSDATAGDVYRYDGPSGNTSAWTFVSKIGAVPADAELNATSANPVQNKVVTEKLTELESEINDLDNKVDGHFYNISAESVKQGYISGDNGTRIYSDSISVYDERYFPMTANEAIEFDSNNYLIQILFYNADKTFNSIGHWFVKDFRGFTPTFDGYFRLSFRKVDASAFAPSNVSAFTISYSKGVAEIVSELEMNVFGEYEEIKAVNLANGYISADNGTRIYTDNVSVHDSRYFPMAANEKIDVDNADNLLVQILAYDTSKNFKASLYWFAKDFKGFTPTFDGYFRIGFRKVDLTNLSPADMPTIIISYSDSLSKKIGKTESNIEDVKVDVSEIASYVGYVDSKAYKNGYYSDIDGVSLKGSNDGASVVNSTFVSVEPNKSYVIKGNPNSYKVALYFYDKDKAYISCSWYGDYVKFTTPLNCNYVRIGLRLIPLTIDTLEANISLMEADIEALWGEVKMQSIGDVYHYGMSAVSNQEEINEIPSQSIYDIRFAKELGYKIIEANLHITKDGKYVVTHGKNGTLGYDFEDLNGNNAFGVVISDTDFETLRTNYRYRTPIEEYRIPITTLEEFCEEAKRCGIMVLLQYKDAASIEIARSILGDSNFFMYDAPRNVYQGLNADYKYFNSVDQILNQCRTMGRPYIYSVDNPFKFDAATLKEICSKLHAEGYYVMSAYLSDEEMTILRGYGFDLFAVTKTARRLAENQKVIGGRVLTFNSDGSVTWESL